MNPNGLISVLETPQGLIFETATICLWLSERHGALAPLPGGAVTDGISEMVVFKYGPCGIAVIVLSGPVYWL